MAPSIEKKRKPFLKRWAGRAALAAFAALIAIDGPLPVKAQNEMAAASSPSLEAKLAKKLQNPLAIHITVPIQTNLDFGIGPERATKGAL